MTVLLYYLQPDAKPVNGGQRKIAQRRCNVGLLLMLTEETAGESEREGDEAQNNE